MLKSKLNVEQELGEGELTIIRPMLRIQQELGGGGLTIMGFSLESEKSTVHEQPPSIGSLEAESAKIYAFLDIKRDEQVVQCIALSEDSVTIGRIDPKRGITPDIDLTPFDPSGTVSRQHARIRLEENLFSIEDLNSRNKTKLGDLIVNPLKPELLQDRDEVCFGSVKATFRLLGTSTLSVPWSQS
jgi:pSer/pThr/pTyr-binding forkhead associated (FHA) protein